MALHLLEGFDGLGDIEDRYFYTNSSAIEVTADLARTGLQCARIAGSTSSYLWFPLSVACAEVYVGFGFYMDQYPPSDSYAVLQFMAGVVAGSCLGVTSAGQLWVGANTSIEDSGANVLLEDTWYYIEIKMIKSNSSSEGDVIVLVNGVEWINCAAGKDFSYSSGALVTDAIRFRAYGASYDRYVDDLYVCDETGPAPHNTFLGQVKIATLYPDGNGNSSNFTGSDADSTDNYLHVDEATPSDVDYVESDNPTDVDLFTYDDLPETPDSVLGVKLCSRVLTDEAGHRLGCNVSRINSTNYDGDDFGAGVEPTMAETLLALNPDDAAAWEEADINGIECGVKVQA